MARVTFLGPPGTFTEEALLSQPDLADGELVPTKSVPDAIAAVERGAADVCVVPLENSIEGSVTVTLDTLAFESDLLIQREIDLPISLVLCARPGIDLGAVKTVLAFPHASAQCRSFLSRKLSDAALVAANSNADAALEVSKSKKAGIGAIANSFAAALYGLEVLAAGIEDHPEAATRFAVIGTGIPAPTGHDKTSIVCFQREDRPGSLLAILSEFAARSINLTKLESRPTKRSLGEYCFFIDFDGHISDELVADVLKNLTAKHADVKFLGSYPVAGEGEVHTKRTAIGKRWRDANRWLDELRGSVRDTTDLS